MSVVKRAPRIISIDLSTARTIDGATVATKPIPIDEPFHQIRLVESTDANCYVDVVLDEYYASKETIKLKERDSIKSGFFIDGNENRKYKKALIFVTAQAGKSTKLIIHYDDEFISGQSLANNTVDVNRATTSTDSSPALGAATQTILAAANTARKTFSFQNNSGVDVWIGGAAVTNSGATAGRKISPGGYFETQTTAAYYAYTATAVAAGLVTVTEET